MPFHLFKITTNCPECGEYSSYMASINPDTPFSYEEEPIPIGCPCGRVEEAQHFWIEKVPHIAAETVL